jgi:hypothetical protein
MEGTKMKTFSKSRFLSAETFQKLNVEDKKRMIEEMEKQINEEIKKDVDVVNRKVERKTTVNVYLKLTVSRKPIIQTKSLDIEKFQIESM